MRVVAGEARGLRLAAPDTTDVRPTGDRVREALFNALYSLDALDGARGLDLFAGTGALGIEALSRGASHVVFVENNPKALEALEANLASTGFAKRATVHRGEALEVLGRLHDGTDITFLDPPYDYAEWSELLDRVVSELVVIESDRPIEAGPEWDVLRTKRYGGTVVSIVRGRNRGRDDDLDGSSRRAQHP